MALVNETTLQELADAVGWETTDEIAAALHSTLRDFQKQLPEMDGDEMGRRAHALKGSCSYLGTEDLYEAAVAADTAHKQGDDVAGALAKVAALIDPSLDALEQVMAKHR